MRIGLYLKIQLNHNFTASVIYDLPFGKGKVRQQLEWPVNAVLGELGSRCDSKDHFRISWFPVSTAIISRE